MKYKTFVWIRAFAVTILAMVSLSALFLGCRRNDNLGAPTSTPPGTVATAPTTETAPIVNAPPEADAPQEPVAAPAETVNEPTAQATGDTAAFTEVHKAILRLQKEPLSNGKSDGKTVKWVYKDAGIKAEFRSDTNKGSDYWNRVKIDYNGNKKDEERWDFKKDGSIKRRVAPGDDENFTEEYTLKGETWVRK